MKCISCNERKGHTRCEGCQQLYCLSCMNRHHEELMLQLELLTDVQKELTESFHVVESTWQTKKEHPCLSAVDQWEQAVISRIQQIAAKVRTTTNEIVTKNMCDIRQRLDQLAFDMEQRQKEGNYLDNDIAEVRNQLEQIDNAIKHINDKVQVNYSATNKVNWDSLIYVTADKKAAKDRFSLPDLYYEQENTQEKLWNNFRKLIRSKHTNNDYETRQTSFKQNTSKLFEPIVLTSFDSPKSSVSPENSSRTSTPSISDSLQSNPFPNNDPFNYVTFTTLDYDRFLPQATDA